MILPGSYANGFAPRDGRPLYPELWRGCVGAWAPCLGPTGLIVRDLSGSRNHGTLTNMDPGTDWVVNGGRYALDFDGSNDYIQVPDSTALQFGTGDFTLSMWVYMRSAATAILISKLFSVGWEVLSFAGFLQAYIAGSASNINFVFTQNQWFHMTLRRRNGVAWLTRNGTENFTTFAATGNVSNVGGEVNIGKRPGTAGNSPNAILDGIQIYNRFLSDQETRILASRRGIAYELAPRRRASVQVAAFNRRRRLLIGAGS